MYLSMARQTNTFRLLVPFSIQLSLLFLDGFVTHSHGLQHGSVCPPSISISPFNVPLSFLGSGAGGSWESNTVAVVAGGTRCNQSPGHAIIGRNVEMPRVFKNVYTIYSYSHRELAKALHYRPIMGRREVHQHHQRHHFHPPVYFTKRKALSISKWFMIGCGGSLGSGYQLHSRSIGNGIFVCVHDCELYIIFIIFERKKSQNKRKHNTKTNNKFNI